MANGFANDVMFAANVDFTGNPSPSATMLLNGQILIGSTVPPKIRVGMLTSTGGSISVTPGPGTLNIEVASFHVGWANIFADQTLDINNGYFCVAPGGALNLALPAVSNVGDVIEVTLDGATSFKITQGAGQQIRIGNTRTTLGVTGSITSTQQGDAIRMVCRTANLLWNIVSSMGSPTVV